MIASHCAASSMDILRGRRWKHNRLIVSRRWRCVAAGGGVGDDLATSGDNDPGDVEDRAAAPTLR